MKRCSLIILTLFLLAACKQKTTDGQLLARAYDNYLYLSDVENLIEPGTSPEDSATIVDNYINQWMQQTVVLEKAKNNVTKNFESELRNYKNSLLTYEYESSIIEQLLDTVVSETEMESYYTNHRDNFLLKSNIVKAFYVKVDKNSPALPRLKKIVSQHSLSDENLLELQKVASIYGLDYNFDLDTWIPFQRLLSEVPIETYNEVAFLRNNRGLVVTDDKYAYATRIVDYKVAEELSPLEYERDHIRTILLNRRKIDIIKNMQRDLLKAAELNNEIERYKH